jgi:transglutaminase-like putative cysteine protease
MSNSTPVSLPSRRLQALVCGLLALSLIGLDLALPLSWPTGLLVLIAGLKLREARRIGERRLVGLLQLLAVGLLAAQQIGLLASAVELLLTAGAIAGLLQLELRLGLRWRGLLRRSLQLLAAALPVALVLFLLVPRLEPIWTLPHGGGSAARTGLNDQIDPGSIATLADNEALAARVAFSDNSPSPLRQRYLRVLVHDRFDGHSWQRDRTNPLLTGSAGLERAAPGGGARQLWLVPGDGLDAVPWDGHATPIGNTLQANSNGELLWRGGNGRSYALVSRSTAAAWQQQAPSAGDLDLPLNAQPRLQALGRRWASLPQPSQRLDAAEAWFRSQPFRYSRSPGTLPKQQGLDVFLFDRQLGFCGHYASAFTALMRAAGVPARVVSGYRGGSWVHPLGGAPYLELRASDAHAWSELWLPGQGWITVDPSRWAGSDPRDAAGSGWRWGQQEWGGLEVAWSRWWLGFDRDRQAGLLDRLFSGGRNWLGLWILLAVAASQGLALLILWLIRRRGGRRRRGVTVAEGALAACLAALAKLDLEPEGGESLEAFCRRAGQQRPALNTSLMQFCSDYQTLRYGRNELTSGRHGLEQKLRRNVAIIRQAAVRN